MTITIMTIKISISTYLLVTPCFPVRVQLLGARFKVQGALCTRTRCPQVRAGIHLCIALRNLTKRRDAKSLQSFKCLDV